MSFITNLFGKKDKNSEAKSRKSGEKKDELSEILSNRANLGNNPPIFYLCNDPERALGLEKIISNFHIVCIDDSPIIDSLVESGSKVFSLARELGEVAPIYRNSNKLLQHPRVIEYIKNNTPITQTAHLIFFKIAPNIEITAEKHGFKILNTSADLNHMFENKLSQFKELFPIGAKFPRTIVCKLGEQTFHNLTKELGTELVIQFDRGHTGLGTMFITSEAQYNDLKEQFPNREVRVAQKIEGEAWTLNACVTRHGIAMGGLNYQVTGSKLLTDFKGGTVGNDWNMVESLTTETMLHIIYQTELIGNEMANRGYKGLFGIDLIIEPDGEIYIIEVNARQPASTGMHTKLMLNQGLVPLSLLHIAEFLYPQSQTESTIEIQATAADPYQTFINDVMNNYQIKSSDYTGELQINEEFIKSQNMEALKPIQASQLILRKLKSGKNVISAQAGIYNNNGFLKSGATIDDLDKSDNSQFLLLKQADIVNIKEGYEVARIQSLNDHKYILKQFKKLID